MATKVKKNKINFKGKTISIGSSASPDHGPLWERPQDVVPFCHNVQSDLNHTADQVLSSYVNMVLN